MKLLMIFMASTVSAVLVLPTVTQAQAAGIQKQVSRAAANQVDALQQYA